jgi:transcriptional regulator CtsR
MASFLFRLVTLCQAADSTFRRRRRVRNSKSVARSRFLRLESMEDRSLLSATVLLQEQDRVPLGPALVASTKAPSVISSNLRAKQAAILQEADAGALNGLSGLSDGAIRVDSVGRMQVYVHVDAITVERVRLLRLAGLQFEASNSDMRVVQGWIPANLLSTLATVSGVKRITAPDYAHAQTGSVTTAGDAILNADDVRALGIDGTGIKVGVISDGVAHSSTVQATGNLPYDLVINPSLPGSGDEGTAMLEIVHDLAPGASLYFSSGLTSVNMVNSINWMVSQGVDVIIDDLGFFGQPYFQDGSVASAAASAMASGVVYVTSAGNEAQVHYQATYVQGIAQGDMGYFHRFSTSGDLGQSITLAAGETLKAFLQWSDQWGASANDYDLYLSRDSDGVIIGSSYDEQNGDDQPLEGIIYTNNTGGTLNLFLSIAKYSGVAKELELFAYRANTQQYVTTGDSIIGHGAVDGVIAVGAISATDSGWDAIQSYSSRGPSTIYTNFAAQTKFLRNSLDGAAIDDVQTRIGQLGYFGNPFGGTSAAAPHAGAIAALLLDAKPSLTPAQVTSALTSTAVDLGTAGYDQTYGYGRFDALAAVNEVLGLTPRRFDFGVSSSPVESGYIQVTPQTTYPSGMNVTYGWSQAQSLTGRDSGSGSNLDRDANITTDGTFQIDVANGTYQVNMHLGEVYYAHDQTGVFLEGIQVDNVTPPSYSGVVTRTYTVTVADGQLNLRLRDLGGYFAGAAITSLVVTPIPTPAPTAPSGLTANASSSSQINLSWTDNASTEDGFKIERKTGVGGTWSQIDSVGANTTSYQSTGLAASTTYYYRVRAYNSTGDSSYSNEANATTQAVPTVPAAPAGLTAQASSSSQINLAWQDNAGNEEGFKVERKTGVGGIWSQIDSVGANSTSYQSTGLTASTTYYYRVRAYNITGDSSFSNEANATTQAPETVPSAPSTLTAQTSSASQINISWQDNSGNEQGFKIERKTGAGGTWLEIATVGANITSYPSLGLTASTTYYYRVRSYNGAGDSSYSNEAFATTSSQPAVTSRFDFGTTSSPVESGYLQVTQNTSYPSGTTVTFGWWQAQSLTGRDTGSGSALDRDANITTDGTFRVDVVNGTYQVDMRLGELYGAHDRTGVFLEGVQVDNVTPTTYFGVVSRSYTVTVADGQLTLGLKDLGGYFAGAAITALVVTPVVTPAPAAPTSLSASAVSSSQINLSWQDNASSEQGFKIERKTGAGGTWSQIASVGANTTTYQSTGLAASTSYYYRVRAYNSTSDSSYSNEANATTSAPETVPAGPSNLGAQASSASQINLSWQDNSTNEQGFKIERKTGVGGTWSEIATVGSNTTTYQSTGLTANTTYYYRVRAYNGTGDSSYSNEANATTSAAQPFSARFDFGISSSPVESGYIQVTPQTSYPSGTSATYGWGQSQSLTGRDAGLGAALDRDVNITTDGTFFVDAPNGTYQVDMRLGELYSAHDQTGVFLEGVQVDNVTPIYYSGVVSRTYTVAIVDGQLSLRLKDLGGYFAGAAIASLVITSMSP